MRTVGGFVFAKANAYDPSFVSSVVHDFIDLPQKNRPSLASCDGWKALIKCRNDAIADMLKEDETSTSAESSLFGFGNVKAFSRASPRLNAAQLADLRENPEVMEYALRVSNGRPELRISTVKFAHTCDDLYVPMD